MTRRPSLSNAACDVTVAGAGVVGLTLAALLARAGLRVAVVEAQPSMPPTARDHYDLRVLAVTRASACVLSTCGAWPRIAQGRYGCFRRMEVWDAGSRGRISFDAADIAEPQLGHIIEQSLLREALEQALRDHRVDWYRPAAMSELSVHADTLDLRLADGRSVATRLLIGADGSDSSVRTLAGIAYERHDYQQTAVVCNVLTDRPHGDAARQRFLHRGPLAFLPLAEECASSVVWSTTADHAQSLLALSDAAFCAELSAAFEHVAGSVSSVGPRAGYPLSRGTALHYVRPRIALIGEAAHTIHPLAGQGANLGLLDAATLAQVVTEAVSRGEDAGSYSVLRRYERWRRGENLLMQLAMDGFKILFAMQDPPLRWLRGMGLSLTDRCTPVKNMIMRRAMGLAGDLPLAALGPVAARAVSRAG